MSDAPAKTEEAAEGEKPKKKSKKVLFIALGVVLLIAGAGVPMFLMGGKPEEAPAAEEEEHHQEEKHLETADLGTYVVNLSEATSFLKAHILVEFDNVVVEKQMEHPKEGEKAAAEEGGKEHEGGEKGGGAAPLPEFMAKREIQIKDTLLRVLSAKKADEVLTPDGKERLKEELIEGLNEAVALEEPPLTAVYFTEFIIQ